MVFFTHEDRVMGIVSVITSTRFDESSTSDNYHFFMNHTQFETNMAMFAIAIQQFIE